MHTHSLTSQTRCCLSEGMSACAGKVTGGLCAPRTSYMWGRLQRDPHEVHSLTCGAAGANKGAQVTNSHALLGSLCPYPRHEPRSEFPGAQRYTPWGGIGAGPSAAAASTCSQWPGGRQTPCATAGSSQLLSYSLLLHSTNEDSQINLPWLCFLFFDIIIFGWWWCFGFAAAFALERVSPEFLLCQTWFGQNLLVLVVFGFSLQRYAMRLKTISLCYFDGWTHAHLAMFHSQSHTIGCVAAGNFCAPTAGSSC